MKKLIAMLAVVLIAGSTFAQQTPAKVGKAVKKVEAKADSSKKEAHKAVKATHKANKEAHKAATKEAHKATKAVKQN